MSRNWQLYLTDIVTACSKVQRYTNELERSAFFADEKTVDAVVRNLEIVGEAAKKVPADVRVQLPNVEWRKIAGFRDWLVHAYFGLDPDIVWDVVSNEIPTLKAEISTFLLNAQDPNGA